MSDRPPPRSHVAPIPVRPPRVTRPALPRAEGKFEKETKPVRRLSDAVEDAKKKPTSRRVSATSKKNSGKPRVAFIAGYPRSKEEREQEELEGGEDVESIREDIQALELEEISQLEKDAHPSLLKTSSASSSTTTDSPTATGKEEEEDTEVKISPIAARPAGGQDPRWRIFSPEKLVRADQETGKSEFLLAREASESRVPRWREDPEEIPFEPRTGGTRLYDSVVESYDKPRKGWCMHDGEEYFGLPYGYPISYNDQTRVMVLTDECCSPGCLLAHILASDTFPVNKKRILNWTRAILFPEHYGIVAETVLPNPPRKMLRKWCRNGFTLEEFRSYGTRGHHVTVSNPHLFHHRPLQIIHYVYSRPPSPPLPHSSETDRDTKAEVSSSFSSSSSSSASSSSIAEISTSTTTTAVSTVLAPRPTSDIRKSCQVLISDLPM